MKLEAGKYTILGSGFGLYGYLPAVADNANARVILKKSYKEKILNRPELHYLLPLILWVDGEEQAFRESETAIFALPPVYQARMAFKCLELSNIKRLILEKPLAPSPQMAQELVDKIVDCGKKYSIGYTFLYTDWFEDLVQACSKKQTDEIFIEWSFMADHFERDIPTWKRYHSEGGGALRFYGIHLIAVLSYLGYKRTTLSVVSCLALDEPVKWEATFHSDTLPTCMISIDGHSPHKKFQISNVKHGKRNLLLDLTDPFELKKVHLREDRRVPILKRVLEDQHLGNSRDIAGLYKKINSLWLDIENQTMGFKEFDERST